MNRRAILSSLAIGGLAATIALAFSASGATLLVAAADPGHRFSASEEAAIAAISARRMKTMVDFLAADELGGRIPGSPGHTKAREYLRDLMAEIGLEPAGQDGSYFHTFRDASLRGKFQLDEDGKVVPHANDTGWNVAGLLRGSDPELAKEVIVFMGHYDHLGVSRTGKVFNGAFDNATGAVACIESARVLKEHGAAPKRSILFLITDGEEGGLRGARAWLEDPTWPLADVVLGISADPLGRPILPDYDAIVISGLERSPALLKLWRQTTAFAKQDVAFVHRGIIPIFASDQDRFHRKKIPAMWFNNPGFSFYHTPEDDAETIDYGVLLDDVRYITRSMLLVGNTSERFAYEGPPPMDAQTGRDATVILEGMLKSEHLTPEERANAEDMLATLRKVIEAGTIDVIPNPQAFFRRNVTFLFQAARRHPGAIPPPWPEDEGGSAPAPATKEKKRRLY